MTKPAIKITAILGSLILFAGALFHLSGTGHVMASINRIAPEVLPVFFNEALAGVWVMPALHWIFIAFLSIGLSRYKSNACAAILMAFGCWIIIDGIVTFMHVGPFLGAFMLGLAGALLLASGVMLRKEARAG